MSPSKPAPSRSAPAPSLERAEVRRYSRHLILPEVGPAGQRALKGARVLLVGAGGLGSPVAMYLAAAGVGVIGIVDGDVVDETNLQRQIIHGTPDVARPKTRSAAAKLAAINPHVRVIEMAEYLEASTVLALLADYDLVVDGSDNFPTRYLVNDACVLLGKPLVYGSVYQFDGQATVFAHRQDGQRGPCYRCLFPEPPPPGTVPSCAEGGVLGVLPGIIGLIQATEAIKIVLERGRTLSGRLLLFEALPMRFRELRIQRAKACPVCGEAPTIHAPIDYEAFCGVPGPGNEDHLAHFDAQIEPAALARRLASDDPPVLLDVREPHEREINGLPDALGIPLDALGEGLARLDPQAETVVFCLVGRRSAQACRQLRAAGFSRVRNLRGGMRAWIDEVDPSLPRY